MQFLMVVAILAAGFVLSGFRVLAQYQRGVVFRLGRYVSTRGAGLTWIVPGIDRIETVDIRTMTLQVEPQQTMTNDNVPVTVQAVVWFSVQRPMEAIVAVKAYTAAVEQTALTALRTTIGKYSLEALLKQQDVISKMLRESTDQVTEPWGIQIERVELKDVGIPASMQRAMAQEAEAHRERLARIIKADAELEASKKLREAAREIEHSPHALELRRMQMLTEVGAEQNTMTVVMIPSEFISAAGAFAKMVEKKT